MHAPRHGRRATLLASALILAAPVAAEIGAEACGPCHGRGAGGIWDEWARSADAAPHGGRSCTACHVPATLAPSCGGTGTGSAVTLQGLRAVAVTVQVRARWVDGLLEVETAICNVGAGHRFPASGSPLELRLVVTATASASSGEGVTVHRVRRHHAIAPLLPLETAVRGFDLPCPRGLPRLVEVTVVHPGRPDHRLPTIRVSTGDWSLTHAGATAWVAALVSDDDLQRPETTKGE